MQHFYQINIQIFLKQYVYILHKHTEGSPTYGIKVDLRAS